MISFADFIAYLAAICTTVAFIPQALLVLKTKNTQAISLTMYTIFIIGLLLWTTFGLLTWQFPIIVANIITVLLALVIWICKISNIRKGEK